MPSLDAFADFVVATGEKMAHSPDDIVNDAVKNTYGSIRRMMRGREASEVVQSGERIRANVMLSHSGTARFYDPNATLQPRHTNVLSTIFVDWRFMVGQYSYTQQELELNSGNPQTYLINLLKSKRQDCYTSIWELLEDALWDEPDNSTMEGQVENAVPYSIPVFVTARPNASGNGLPYGWTGPVMNIASATEVRWRNQQQSYNAAAPAGPDDGLVNAFDHMWHMVRFIGPGTAQEYFESDMLQRMCIQTNRHGRVLYQRLTRESNDRLSPANDLGWTAGTVTYNGLPMDYVARLDNATGLAGSSGVSLPNNKPQYYFLNFNYLYVVWHARRYMVETKPGVSNTQPFTHDVFSDTYYNMIGRSRYRQGVVYAG